MGGSVYAAVGVCELIALRAYTWIVALILCRTGSCSPLEGDWRLCRSYDEISQAVMQRLKAYSLNVAALVDVVRGLCGPEPLIRNSDRDVGSRFVAQVSWNVIIDQL